MRRHHTGPMLPRELRDQVGGAAANRKHRPRHSQPLNRKDRRKAERTSMKQRKQQPRYEDRRPGPSNSEVVKPPRTSTAAAGIPKSISKKPTIGELSSSTTAYRPSRAVQDRLAQDDAEIAALERKLGRKGKRKRKADDDGRLDDIFGDLGGLDSDEDASTAIGMPKQKRAQDEEWLARKRRKALSLAEPVAETFDGEEYASDALDADAFDFDEDDEDDEDDADGEDQGKFDDLHASEDESEFSGFDSDDECAHDRPRVRENPYIAPFEPGPQRTKYIPPALRGPASSNSEAFVRLRRQIQGLLNRLSDANMLTILRGVEQIYQTNARGYVTTVLIDLLVGLLADESSLPDPFLILHAGFIAATYKVIGLDFGAQMVERIVNEFDRYFQRPEGSIGKQATNLITVTAQLYGFQVIGSNLLFDYIRLFLGELSELNTELLLRIVKVSGPSLRQDDPRSLKDIVLLLQQSVARAGKDNLPVRTKFMIETINDLKNNRMKTGVAASVIASEHTTRMKKQLGSLNSRTLKGTEPLRIGLTDIKNTDKKGKWWLVGASWRNDTTDVVSLPEAKEMRRGEADELGALDEDGEVDLFRLAREQGMNTDVRRAIFINLLSATDQNDAHIRLVKLNLKKSQEMEIPRVIVHCVGREEAYNHFYTLVAQKFCASHKLRKSFQFALWDVFRSLGEKKYDDDDESGGDDSSTRDTSSQTLANLGTFYGTLIAKNVLSIASLKNLNFAYLRPGTQELVELILVTVILESQRGLKGKRDEKALLNIFINADTAAEMIAGLQYFMKKRIKKTRICSTKEEETVRWGCDLVMRMLERLMAATVLEED